MRPEPLLFVLLVVGVAVVSMVMRAGRARAMLDAWAAQNGYRLLRAERRLLFRGPYFLTAGKSREVYFIEVDAGDGHVRRGYARCGGAFLGLWADRVDVRWDDSYD